MLSKKKVYVALIVVVLAGGGHAGWRAWQKRDAPVVATAREPTIATAKVTRGNLILSADGAGSLEPRLQLELGFPTGGTLLELGVSVGDRVKAGDVLARIGEREAQQAVLAAEVGLLKAKVDLQTAQTNLADVKAGPTKAELLTAQAAVETAKKALDTLKNGPTATELAQLQMALDQAKNNLYSAQMNRDAAGRDNTSVQFKQAEVNVWNAEANVRKAQMALDEARAPADAAELAEAEARLATAQETLKKLKDAPTAEDISAAELKVKQAEMALAEAEEVLATARENLTKTTLTAPVDGTVLSVAYDVNEEVKEGTPVITLVDLNAPLVSFYVEEEDMGTLQLGNQVNVTLDALENAHLSGKIVRVEPSIASVGNTPAVQAWASLDLTGKDVTLYAGMTCEVEVIAGESRNTLLVPVGALREIEANQYAVFVVKDDGELEMRSVTVGLKDTVQAEIKAGVSEGEVVRVASDDSAGLSGQGSQINPNQVGFPAQGGMFFFEAGGRR